MVALVLAVAFDYAYAAQWTITPRLYTSESYIDNVTLASISPLDDFITEITPGVSMRADGARLKLNLDYNYQILRYAYNSNFNMENSQLQGGSTATIVKDLFFVDARGNIGQQQINPAGRVSNSNLNVTGNRATITTYGISPYLRHHLGPYADSEVRYDFDNVSNSGNNSAANANVNQAVNSITGDSTTFTSYLKSGRYFQRLPWRVEYSKSETTGQSSTASNATFEKYSGELSYVINRKYRINGTGGYDNNTYSSSQGGTSGPYWTLGGTWTPSLRTELTAAFGQRYFGNTFSMKATHRHRRWAFSADYSEEPRIYTQQVLRQQLIPLTDLLGQQTTIDPSQFSNIYLAINTPQLTNQVYIEKRLNIGLRYESPRNRVSVNGYSADQTLQVSGGALTQRGVNVDWTHFLAPRLDGGMTGTFDMIDSGGLQTMRYELSPYIDYKLGRRISAKLQYRYLTSDSDTATAQYTENVITGSLSMHY